MRKRILMLAVLCMALLSCRQEEAPLPAGDAPQERIRLIAADADPVRISYGEAVGELEAMLEAMDGGPKTKSGVRRIGRMEAVTSGLRTRSGNVPDTLLYVVDLEGGEGGYAVMSAVRTMPSTLVIADQGRGDAGRLTRMITNTATEDDLADETAFADGLVADYVRSLIVPDSIPMSGDFELITPFPGGAYGQWKTVKQKGPMIQTKWNQTHPFNYKLGVKSGRKVYAGCGTIAMAQIMAYFEYPKELVMPDGKFFTPDWKHIKRMFSTCTDYIKPSDHGPIDTLATLGQIIAYDLQVNWNEDGWGFTSVKNISLTMQYLYGYGFSRLQKGYNASLFRSYFQQDKPIIIQAESSTTRYGHIFLLDGIKQYSRNIYKYVYYIGGRMETILDGTQHREYVHANFGWGGSKDGWFEHAIFDVENRLDSEPTDKVILYTSTSKPTEGDAIYDHDFWYVEY